MSKIDITVELREFHNFLTEMQDRTPHLAYLGFNHQQIRAIMQPLHKLKMKFLALEADVYEALRQEARDLNDQGYVDGKAVGEIKAKYCRREPRIWGLV